VSRLVEGYRWFESNRPLHGGVAQMVGQHLFRYLLTPKYTFCSVPR